MVVVLEIVDLGGSGDCVFFVGGVSNIVYDFLFIFGV